MGLGGPTFSPQHWGPPSFELLSTVVSRAMGGALILPRLFGYDVNGERIKAFKFMPPFLCNNLCTPVQRRGSAVEDLGLTKS